MTAPDTSSPQRLADDWNRQHPTGTPVTVNGTPTVTRDIARVVGGDVAIWVGAFVNPVPLAWVTPDGGDLR